MKSSESQQELVDQLTTEFLESCRNGDSPDPETYVDRYPELADTIRELFPMIAALESMKRDDQREIARTATQLPLDLTELGDFEIVREIGRGGMGIVYEAEQRSLARRVALKVLPKQALLDPVQLQSFEREARIVARLHHTHVVSLYGAGEHNGYHFLAMELVQGESLNRLIQALKSDDSSNSTLPESLRQKGTQRHWDEVATIGRDAALGLQHAHERGVLHRDITPSNLLLDEHGNVMLSDFGMARIRENQDSVGTQTLGGTLCYLAPEIFSGTFDERSDVFGLGVTLYEFATLNPAFADSNPAEAVKRIASQSFHPKRPREFDASIPRDLETILLKSMAEQPQHRYGSADELAEDFQRFLERRPILARRSSVFEHAWRWCRRNSAVAAMSALAIASLIALSILMTFSFIQARSAKLSIEVALARETQQRERLDATVDVATNVLNNIYNEVVPSDLHIFEKSPSDDEANSNTTAAPTLSDDMAGVLDNLLEFYDQLAEQGGGNQDLIASSAAALGRVADIYRQLGQPDKAMTHYTTAIATLDQLQQRDATDVFPSLQQARIYNEIGRLYYADDRQDELVDNHQKALAILEKLAEPSPEYRNPILYEIARAHYFLGRNRTVDAARVASARLSGRRPPRGTRRPRGNGSKESTPDLDRREKHLNLAIAAIDKLPNGEQHEPKNQFLLACCYREFLKPYGPIDSATSTYDYRTAKELLTDLVARFENNPHYRYELIETLRHQVGEFHHDQSEVDLTGGVFREALSHAENLTDHHPNVPLYWVARMHILHRQGHSLLEYAEDFGGQRREDLLGEAVAVTKDALAQTETLVDRWPDRPAYQMWQVVVGGSLAKVLLELGENDQAATVLGVANGSLKSLMDSTDPKSPLGEKLPEIERALRDLSLFAD